MLRFVRSQASRASSSILARPPTVLACVRPLATKAKKSNTAFVCNSCGYDSVKWFGKCPSCGELNTASTFSPAPSATASRNTSPASFRPNTARSWLGPPSAGARAVSAATQLLPLSAVPDASHDRVQFGSGELNRLFGGGLTRGAATLWAGSPGVGKSTLLLQIAALLGGARAADSGKPYAQFFCSRGEAEAGAAQQKMVVYISGEESAGQIKARAGRLNIDCPSLLVLNETRVEDLLQQLSSAAEHSALAAEATEQADGATAAPVEFAAVIVDSIQTVFTDAVPAAAGSVTQVRESAVRLVQWAKANQVPLFLVGHVTKSGDIAGPRVLEHLVDTVMYVEGEEAMGLGHGSASDSAATAGGLLAHSHRLVRCTKNRFGSTSEVGIFEMTNTGFVESNPAHLFLSRSPEEGGEGAASGCAVTVTIEGSRALCVETQALVTRSTGPYPRYRGMGVATDRLHLLTAVLQRHSNVTLKWLDVIANVVGGLRICDPASDLAIAIAIASSTMGLRMPANAIFIGEVGLGGELRHCLRLQDRLRAASKVGFRTAYVPASAAAGALGRVDGMRVIPVRTLAETIARVFGPAAFVKRGEGRSSHSSAGGGAGSEEDSSVSWRTPTTPRAPTAPGNPFATMMAAAASSDPAAVAAAASDTDDAELEMSLQQQEAEAEQQQEPRQRMQPRYSPADVDARYGGMDSSADIDIDDSEVPEADGALGAGGEGAPSQQMTAAAAAAAARADVLARTLGQMRRGSKSPARQPAGMDSSEDF